MTVVETHINPRDADVTGRVSNGYIKVQAPLARCVESDNEDIQLLMDCPKTYFGANEQFFYMLVQETGGLASHIRSLLLCSSPWRWHALRRVGVCQHIRYDYAEICQQFRETARQPPRELASDAGAVPTEAAPEARLPVYEFTIV